MDSAPPPFPADAFEILASAEANHWWFRARNRVILWALKKYAGSFKNFLEIGCGTAFVLEGVGKAFPSAELHGSEYFEEGLVHARKRLPNAQFKQLDATAMSEESRYDVIGAFDVVEHIEQDELTLKNLVSALKPGGTLMVSVPQHQWLWSHTDEIACHVRRYSRSEMISKIKATGLDVLYATSFVSLLVPVMWLSRKQSQARHDDDPQAELKIPHWLNSALEMVMKVEFLLIRAGVSLPVGGSLIVIARKK
ncbi:SAM-dependent methyltransferase [Pseudomonas sp. S25]|uniref:SAM-dependent methyltransferase n=1 Tax=Pseudomonas maioricensis TaxID=1766623 RepID=A0ABS9ZJ80_9PSED|nr:class I SAM-dependent methyltransferase [Pseudomonas sp. S25]MCI8210644.1 SAM-dependent methyltransferase [Pseudomonas sp. S25]